MKKKGNLGRITFLAPERLREEGESDQQYATEKTVLE